MAGRPVWRISPVFDDLSPKAPPDAASAPPARTYRAYPEAVWKNARQDYAEGWSAKEVCTRYDLGLSALRTRARNEGWRRADLAEDEPLPSPTPEPPEALPLLELVDLAWRSASQAIARGKVYEARAWMRLNRELRDQIKIETGEAEHRASLPEKNLERAGKGWPLLSPSLHPLHPISRVQSAPGEAPASPLPVDNLQHQHRSGQQEADGVGGDQGPAFQSDPVGDPQGEADHGGEVHTEGDGRGVPLFQNFNHLWGETAHGKQGGGDTEGDDVNAHRPSTTPNARGCGGMTPCGPG